MIIEKLEPTAEIQRCDYCHIILKALVIWAHGQKACSVACVEKLIWNDGISGDK